ncbi:GDSL-type esterase/lipase family protein [Streptomyces smyrnaeus]|uniref:GDSL-type esterase/lipase family protein n=1 Tax=Streptomyces smyrnaeus TaxID=1387713 RepID=UPI0033FCA99B
MRVLFVGDSMTIGAAGGGSSGPRAGGDHTWRYRMWQHLCRTVPDDEDWQIVGPRTALHEGSHAYADPHFPHHARAHLAGWGAGWLHMAPLVRETVASYRADTLLVSLGLIDLGFYTDPEQTLANVELFLAEARAGNPTLRAVLLPVMPNIRAVTDPAFADACARFNTLLAKAVAELSQPRSPLLLASVPHDWSPERDTYDGTHPSAEGEHRMAAAFADALHQAWGVGGPYRTEPADERVGG